MSLLTCMMAASCGKDDADVSVDDNNPFESYPITPTRIYSNDEFRSMFVGGVWTECGVYNVYEDGSISDEITLRLLGYLPVYFYVKDQAALHNYIDFIDPTMEDKTNIVSYTYDSSLNWLKFEGFTVGFGGLNHPLIIIDMTKDLLKCLGEVPVKQWDLDAKYGLYCFRRLSEESSEKLRNRFNDNP